MRECEKKMAAEEAKIKNLENSRLNREMSEACSSSALDQGSDRESSVSSISVSQQVTRMSSRHALCWHIGFGFQFTYCCSARIFSTVWCSAHCPYILNQMKFYIGVDISWFNWKIRPTLKICLFGVSGCTFRMYIVLVGIIF